MLLRTSENRSLRAASFGSNSVKRTPGVRVAIVAKGPRYSTGAFGFGSNKSKWLGPPPNHSSSIDLAFGVSGMGHASRRLGKDAANGATNPACRKARRVVPEQSRV